MLLRTWCNNPGFELILLISAMATGMIAAFVVGLVRGHQLQRWDLRKLPVAPSATRILLIPLGAILLAVLLSLDLYIAEPCAPEQKTANILSLWAVVPVVAALCPVGLYVAKRRYEGRSRQ